MAQLPMTLISPQALLSETTFPVTVKPPEGEVYTATNTGYVYLGDITVTGGTLEDIRIYVACGCNETERIPQVGFYDFLFLTNNDSITNIAGNLQRVYYTTNTTTGEQTEHTGKMDFRCSLLRLKDMIKYVHASGLIENENDNAINNAIWDEYILKEFGATKIFWIRVNNPYMDTTGYLGGSFKDYNHSYYMLTDDRFADAYARYLESPGAVNKGTFAEASKIYVSQLE